MESSEKVLEKGSENPVAGLEINLAHELLGHGKDANEGKMNDETKDGLQYNEYQASHA